MRSRVIFVNTCIKIRFNNVKLFCFKMRLLSFQVSYTVKNIYTGICIVKDNPNDNVEKLRELSREFQIKKTISDPVRNVVVVSL